MKYKFTRATTDIMKALMAAVGVFTAFAIYQFLKLIHNLVRRAHVAHRTGLLDLPLLAAPRKDGKNIEGTAVICGGSIAGLLAARICHDHFERVVIVEAEGWLSTQVACPDDASELPQKRTRLLQWDAFQTFQAWGALCLSRLFPDLASECAKSRISLIPALGKLFVSGKQVLTPVGNHNGSLPKIVSAGRPGLETLIRRLVIGRKMYPRIEQIHGTVVGYEKDPKNPQYLSKVVVRQGSNNEVIAIPATLIVDCTGPASVGVKMLRRLGFGTPTGHDVDYDSFDDLTIGYDQIMKYTTFSIPATDDMIQRFPEQARVVGPIRACLPDWMKDRRLILSQRIDRNIIQLLAAGWGTVEPPTDLQSLETFARSLNFEVPMPEWWFDLVHVLREAEDRMITSKGRVPASVYTQFHRATNMPSNWTAVGDSVMRVNPILAQGINKALLGLVSLNSLLHQAALDRLPQDFAKRFFDIQAKKIEPLWNAVKGVDYNYDTTTPLVGETLSTNRYIRQYMRLVMRVATKDRQAGSTVWHVTSFLAPPIDYFHPYVVLRVIWEMIQGA